MCVCGSLMFLRTTCVWCSNFRTMLAFPWLIHMAPFQKLWFRLPTHGFDSFWQEHTCDLASRKNPFTLSNTVTLGFQGFPLTVLENSFGFGMVCVCTCLWESSFLQVEQVLRLLPELSNSNLRLLKVIPNQSNTNVCDHDVMFMLSSCAWRWTRSDHCYQSY